MQFTMASNASAPARTRLRFPAWEQAYEETLQATDRNALFALVEIAESAILIRRDRLNGGSRHRTERRAIEDALRVLAVIKEGQLMFPSDYQLKPRVVH